MERSIGEALAKVEAAENDEEKLAILQENKDIAKFAELAEMLTDESIDFWDIPDTAVYGFQKNVFGRCPTLMSEIKILRYFKKPTIVREDRLVAMFLGMVDKLHATEAEFMTSIINRSELPYVSNDIIREAFGFTQSEPVKPAKVVKEKVEEPAVETVVEVDEEPVVEAVKPKAKPKAKSKAKKTTKK